MGRSSLGCLIFVVIAQAACSSPGSSNPARRAERQASRTPMIDDVIPIVGGNAYAVGMPSGVWFLSGSSARPIRVIGDSATRHQFSRSVLLQIQPTSDGGAYAFSIAGGIWRLDADTAR